MRPTTSAPPLSDQNVNRHGGKSKGKGIGKARPRAKEAALSKRFDGALTRRREKKMREEEERIQRSMGKLMSTGKKLINRDIALDNSTDSSDNELPHENPVGDFSSHDLT